MDGGPPTVRRLPCRDEYNRGRLFVWVLAKLPLTICPSAIFYCCVLAYLVAVVSLSLFLFFSLRFLWEFPFLVSPVRRTLHICYSFFLVLLRCYVLVIVFRC